MNKFTFGLPLLALAALCFCFPAYALQKGNSAWVYGKRQAWVNEILVFNKTTSPDCQINTLFPETAIVHINENNHSLNYHYDKSVTRFYKSHLPDVKILPDFSFWVAHTNFMHWNQNDYQRAATRIAKDINNDASADGLFLDLENYQPALLPFYKTLATLLAKKHKILSAIVRPGQENSDWFNLMSRAGFVVLYGYDLHEPKDGPLPISPERYQERLKSALQALITMTEKTNTPFMGGVPAIATTYEWEEKLTINNHKPLTMKSRYQQSDFLHAAVSTYRNSKSLLFLGYAIWAFVDDPTRIHELPSQLLPQNLEMLKTCRAG